MTASSCRRKGSDVMSMVVGKIVLGASEGKSRAWLSAEDKLARALRENERLREEIKELKRKVGRNEHI